VLKKQRFQRVYIDAFAGTGYRQEKRDKYDVRDLFDDLEADEPKEFLKGSAKLALEASPSFDRYIFIESDKGKINELEKLREEHPGQAGQIEIEQSDANAFIQGYCTNENWRNARAVLFLDPFATEVEWGTIEAVARTQSIDVWILFPVMAVNRLLARDPKKVWYEHLNRIFGTEDWFRNFYKTEVWENIFGKPVDIIKRACDFESIGSFYKGRLETIFAGVAKEPKVLYNSRGTALFQFFFAAGNARGSPIVVRIAEHLIGRM
jgi:three-Cys-motif partner protein